MTSTTKPAATSYTVELPLPPKGCSKNVRKHWTVRHKANASYRSDCALLYRAAKIPALGPIRLSLEYFNGGRTVGVDDGLYRPLDDPNAITAFAAGQDALVDAGVIPYDTRRYVRQGPVTIHGTKQEHKGRCCVVLTITEIER